MNSLPDLPQILVGELGISTGMFLVRFEDSKLSWLISFVKFNFQTKLGF